MLIIQTYTSAEPNSLLGSQQPAFSESPQSATAGADASPAPYATESLSQSPQNPTRQQLLQPQNAQQHLSPSNSPMTHPNVHISATDDSPAARPLENATASNAAPVASIPSLSDPMLPPPAAPAQKVTKPPLAVNVLSPEQPNILLANSHIKQQQKQQQQPVQSLQLQQLQQQEQQQVLNSGAKENSAALSAHMASKAFPGSLPDAPLNAPVPLASSQPQTLVIPVAVPTDSVLNKSGGSQEAQPSRGRSIVNKQHSIFSTVAQTPANGQRPVFYRRRCSMLNIYIWKP